MVAGCMRNLIEQMEIQVASEGAALPWALAFRR
jgi:hypothetical protein